MNEMNILRALLKQNFRVYQVNVPIVVWLTALDNQHSGQDSTLLVGKLRAGQHPFFLSIHVLIWPGTSWPGASALYIALHQASVILALRPRARDAAARSCWVRYRRAWACGGKHVVPQVLTDVLISVEANRRRLIDTLHRTGNAQRQREVHDVQSIKRCAHLLVRQTSTFSSCSS